MTRRRMASRLYGLETHPAAQLFPMMTTDEIWELADDIEQHGQLHPIIICDDFSEDAGSPAQYLLDGRNRLMAFKLMKRKPEVIGTRHLRSGAVDPYAYVISANAKRRHLTAEQKRAAILALKAVWSEASDRAIGRAIGVDHKTVAAAVARAAAGEIPHDVDKPGAIVKAALRERAWPWGDMYERIVESREDGRRARYEQEQERIDGVAKNLFEWLGADRGAEFVAAIEAAPAPAWALWDVFCRLRRRVRETQQRVAAE
jgi:hypothetical protein